MSDEVDSSSECPPTIGDGRELTSPNPLTSINLGARRGEDVRIECDSDEWLLRGCRVALADCVRRSGSVNAFCAVILCNAGDKKGKSGGQQGGLHRSRAVALMYHFAFEAVQLWINSKLRVNPKK